MDVDFKTFNRNQFLKQHAMLRAGDPTETSFVNEYLNRFDVKKALHIPSDKVLQPFEMCNRSVLIDYKTQFDGSVWIYESMMKENYKLLHYSGNTDGAVPTSGTEEWISKKKFPVTNKTREYTTGDEGPTGNITGYGNFVYATINGTGHMAP